MMVAVRDAHVALFTDRHERKAVIEIRDRFGIGHRHLRPRPHLIVKNVAFSRDLPVVHVLHELFCAFIILKP